MSAVTCWGVPGAWLWAAGHGPSGSLRSRAGRAECAGGPQRGGERQGWGTRASVTTRARSREARALWRARSPGKRRGRARARTAWPVTAVGAGTRADPSPRLWLALEGEGRRGCSGASAGVNARNAELAARSRLPQQGAGSGGRGNGFVFLFFFYLEDLWPLVGMCS